MTDRSTYALKRDLKIEIRTKLYREYQLTLPNHTDIETESYDEVMEEMRVELLQLEGRHPEGNDVYREEFINKVFNRNEFARLMLEPIDYSEYYNEDGSLK